LIDRLVGAGLESLRFGFQTGSDYIRRRIYNRPGKNEDIVAFTNTVAKHGIVLRHDLIMDNPYETAESLEETIELFMSLPEESNVDLYSLKYYPNFPLTNKAIADGIIKPIDEFDDAEIEGTSKDLSYVPRPAKDRKVILQNIMWLVACTQTSHWLIRYGVFGKSFGSKIVFRYLYYKSLVMGKLIGDGGWSEKYPVIRYAFKSFDYLRKGDVKMFWAKSARRLGFKAKNQGVRLETATAA
jgi:hypothetical protein